MAKITVYHYEITDSSTGNTIHARAPATRGAITAADGKLLSDTAIDVDLKWVSDDGVVIEWPLPETHPADDRSPAQAASPGRSPI